MPVVSAVVHVAPEHIPSILREFSEDPRLTVGAVDRDRIPVVACTADRHGDKDVWRKIEKHPDVRFIELAFADFSDIHTEPEVD